MEELYKAIEEDQNKRIPRERFPERTFTTSAIRSMGGKRMEAMSLLSKFDDDVIFEYHISNYGQ